MRRYNQSNFSFVLKLMEAWNDYNMILMYVTFVVSACILYPLCVLYVFKSVGNNKNIKIKIT